MTYREAALSLQLIAERSIGAPRRSAILAAKAAEDAAANAAATAIRS